MLQCLNQYVITEECANNNFLSQDANITLGLLNGYSYEYTSYSYGGKSYSYLIDMSFSYDLSFSFRKCSCREHPKMQHTGTHRS